MPDSLQTLLEIYRKSPCRTLPNAFWKTTRVLDALKVLPFKTAAGQLRELSVWQADRLMALWCAENIRHLSSLTAEEKGALTFGLIHAHCLPFFHGYDFTHREAYFRLMYTGQPPAAVDLAGFAFEDVDPPADIADIVNVIQTCYPGIKVNGDIIQRWLAHPVYDPDLWVWIVDEQSGQRAALGIAELDPLVSEASLEWIQVMPDYRRKGLGKALVGELLRRIAGSATFTTVAGKANDPSRPEMLYRACGFEGSDVWWLLRKDV